MINLPWIAPEPERSSISQYSVTTAVSLRLEVEALGGLVLVVPHIHINSIQSAFFNIILLDTSFNSR